NPLIPKTGNNGGGVVTGKSNGRDACVTSAKPWWGIWWGWGQSNPIKTMFIFTTCCGENYPLRMQADFGLRPTSVQHPQLRSQSPKCKPCPCQKCKRCVCQAPPPPPPPPHCRCFG